MLNPYAAMEIISVVFIFIILISLLANWKKAEITTKFFALNIFLIIIGTICDIIEITFGSVISTQADLNLIYVSCLIGNFLSISFSYYCTFQANTKDQLISLWIPRIVLIVDGLSMIVITVAQFAGKLFIVNGDEISSGWPLYYLFVSELSTTTFLVVNLCIYRKKIGNRIFIALLILITTPAIGLIIEAFIPTAYISYSTLSVSTLIQYVLLQSSVINRAEMRSQIESEVSRTDVLTSLQNRRAYTELLDSITEPGCFGALFFDVNGLKITNDTQGHLAGDTLIKNFANLLRETLPETKLFRISGDEFVAFYQGLAQKRLFESNIVSIKVAIDKHNSIASMGSSFEEYADITQVITEAEKNMYLDKEEYYQRTGHDRRKR